MTWRSHIPEDQRRAFRETERAAKAANRKETKAERLARAKQVHASALANARDPRRRNEPFLRFVRLCPCLACAITNRQQVTRTEAAHVRRAYPGENGWRPVGGGETPHDFRCLPLCVEHHREGEDAQHSRDSHDWYAELGIYPPEVCAELMDVHRAGTDPAETVEAIAARCRNGRRPA